MQKPLSTEMWSEERLEALLYNAFALDWMRQTHLDPNQYYSNQHGKTRCSFYAAKLTFYNEQNQITSLHVHLAQTGPFVLLVDAASDDLLLDFIIPAQICIVAPIHQVILIKMEEQMMMLQIPDPVVFEQIMECMTPEQLLRALQQYHNYLERGVIYV